MTERPSVDDPEPDTAHLARACQLGVDSVRLGGGPFGAVVTRGDDVVAEGANRVTTDDDPTAHAEVVALRAAGAALGTHDLSGLTLYASCRPCPMCMAAAWWARVDRIVYAADSAAAAAAGFDDARFWAGMVDGGAAPVRPEHIDHPAAGDPFSAWAASEHREDY